MSVTQATPGQTLRRALPVTQEGTRQQQGQSRVNHVQKEHSKTKEGPKSANAQRVKNVHVLHVYRAHPVQVPRKEVTK